MTPAPTVTTVELRPGRPFAAAIHGGIRIRVLKGTIWATTCGSGDDAWLQAGDELLIPTACLCLLEAVDEPANVALLAADTKGGVPSSSAAFVLRAMARGALTVVFLVIVPARLRPTMVPCAAVMASAACSTHDAPFLTSIRPEVHA